MKAMFIKWRNSTAGKLSVILIAASILLCLFAGLVLKDHCIGEKLANFISNIFIGIGTNLCGIVVTISFVQYFIDKQSEKDDREKERKQILRHNMYMDVLIDKYFSMYLSVTSRFNDRFVDVEISKVPERNIKFSDLADMYQMSFIIGEGLLEPAIKGYYTAERTLRECMLRMIESIDFQYFPQIDELLQEFVRISKEEDVSGELINNLNIKSGVKSHSEICAKNIADDEEHDWVGKYERGELGNNIMLPYVIFYLQIQKECKLLTEYKKSISEISDRRTEA